MVSTDSRRVASVAKKHGGDLPFLRPSALARDETPMLPVLQHALRAVEQQEGQRYKVLALLQPTSPARLPVDLKHALKLLSEDPKCVGLVAVSETPFNPYYVCVEDGGGGYIGRTLAGASNFSRRQDVPPVFRINGVLYVWRRDYIMSVAEVRLDEVPHRMLVIPKERAIDIDNLHDFQLAELAIREGLVRLPWLRSASRRPETRCKR